MNQEIAHRDQRAESLEQVLEQLEAYGQPSVSRLERGWHCCIKLRTPALGTEFRIRSEFDLPTPTAAAIQCHERVRDALPSHSRSITT